jgi:hypothetical protein
MFKSGFLFKVIFSLLFTVALVYLARVGVADFMRLAPCAYVEAVQKGEERPISVKLLEARDRLINARSWDLENPLIPEYLGQIAIIRGLLISLSPMLQEALFREAIEDFDAALALRPNSAYLWAERMTAGTLLLEANGKSVIDNKLVLHELPIIAVALRHATELGPWEPKILEQVVRVGRLRYESFSDETRALIVAAVVRADKLQLNI